MKRREFLGWLGASGLAFGAGSLVGTRPGWATELLASTPRTGPAQLLHPVPPHQVPHLTVLYDPEELLYEGPRVGFFAERAERLAAVAQRLAPLWSTGKVALARPPRAAMSDLVAVHAPWYVAYIETLASLPQSEFVYGVLNHKRVRLASHVEPVESDLPPYEAARLSAGGAVAAVDLVMGGKSRTAFSLGRPPGHHARPHWYKGFCIFNNAAVAARHAQRRWGAKRVMVLDWDVHHGNGTQEIFYRDPSVLYLSTHEERIYPFSGKVAEVGAGAGEGFNVNVPLPRGTGDGGYARIFESVVAPVAEQFKPDLIVVSAGQDPHGGERLAHMQVSDRGFAHIAEVTTQLAHRVCGGKLVLLLEGGYNPVTLASSTEAIARVLAELDHPGSLIARDSARVDHLVDAHLRQVVEAQQDFWKLG